MLRLFVATTAVGAAAIASAGAAVALIWSVSWGDGIGAVCLAGSILWLAVALVPFFRWLIAGASPGALRAAAASAFIAVVFAGMWFEVRFVAYDGCNHGVGDQPALTVPISLITRSPSGRAASWST